MRNTQTVTDINEWKIGKREQREMTFGNGGRTKLTAKRQVVRFFLQKHKRHDLRCLVMEQLTRTKIT